LVHDFFENEPKKVAEGRHKMPTKRTQQKYIKNRSITKDGELTKDDYYLFYDPFKEGVGYNLKYRSAFVKNYLGISLPCGNDGFTDIELGRIYRISKLMYSDSNLLARRSNNDITPVSRDEIQLMLGMHRTKFVPFWKKLSEYRILKPIAYPDGTYFCMNPLYYNSTTYLPIEIYLAFQDEIKEHIPTWVAEKYLEMQEKPKEGERNEEVEGQV
jgi:hypothetical protein